MEISVEKFMNSLPIMGMGMLGIFLVTLVIIAVIALMNLLTNREK